LFLNASPNAFIVSLMTFVGLDMMKPPIRGTTDDDKFEGLVEDVELPAHRHVSTENAPEGDNKTDDHIHVGSPAMIYLQVPSHYGASLV
jgi:hypothetical protein